MNSLARHLGLAATTLAAAGTAGAQSAADAAAAVQQVVVSGHYENAIGTSDAASQGTVRGERLTDLPLLRPGEVLETIPGIVVTQHSGDGKANQYFLRGYNLDHGTDFATSVDGVPVNMPTNAHGQGYTDLNFLIPELVDRIEYRKGPYFAEDGDFASAGSARIRYRDQVEAARAEITVGSEGYRRLLLADSPTLGGALPAGLRTLAALELERDDGPWTTPEALRKFNGLLRLSGGTRAAGWSADAIGYHAQWTSTDQVPRALIESGALGRYDALDPTDGGASDRQFVTAEWHRADEGGFTSASAYVEHYALRLWSNFTFFALRPGTGDQFEQRENRHFTGGQVAQGWNHSLFGRDSTTEAGLQLRYDRIDVRLDNTQARVAFETVNHDLVDETSLAAYLQNNTTWTPWLRTLVGVRADRFGMRTNALQIPANSGSADGDKVSPKVSAVLGPWLKTEFFVNAGRGFHSNDARGVIDKIDSTTGNPASPVPALVASRGEEIGLRSEILPGLQTSMALWRLDSDSELVYSTNSDIGSTEANGASRRHGFEWNNHLALGRWLLVDADMAWTHARYADADANGDSGNRIPNAVGRVGMLGLTVNPSGPWSIGLVTRYIGAYPLSQDGALTAPSAYVTNLKLKRDFGPHCTVSLDVLNLFDRRFYDIAYEQDYQASRTAPVVENGVTVHPGEPRALRLALDVKL